MYKFLWKSCNAIYIDQSKQYLKNRFKHHKFSTKKDPTALREHTVSKLHLFDIYNHTILDTEINCEHRIILEMIYIQKHLNWHW